MKKLICLLLLCCTSALSGEENLTKALWHIVRHPINTDAARTQVSDMVEKGYMPMGLHVEEGNEIHILYLLSEQKVMNKWRLEYFNDLGSFEEKCTEFILQGWVPTGISRANEGLFMLFINADLEMKEWKVTAGWKKFDTAKTMIEKYSARGFSCYGISAGPDDRFWYLFLKTPQSAESSNELLISPVDPTRVYKNIYAMMANKWLPCGITLNNGEYNIMLVK